MRHLALSITGVSLVVMAACGPKTVPLPTISSPRFPDYVAPVVPAPFANSVAAQRQRRGWTFLQAGDLKNAEREFAAALETTPLFYLAEIGLGYVALADRDPKAALARFDRVLDRQPAEPSALAGRGEANLALGKEADALAAFEAAAAADSALTEIARRVEVLKFRNAEQQIDTARAAASAGRIDEAIDAYTAAIANSPGSAFLYRELAGVERQKGDVDAAFEHFTAALDRDPADTGSLIAMGEIHEARGRFDLAANAYQEALKLEPGGELSAKLAAAAARDERTRLPPEYRAIDASPQITRGDLAALIGFRLASVLAPNPGADAEPITDVRGDWAANWILRVTLAGIMEPFANHAFQPGTVVRRIDMAEAVARLLTRIAPQQVKEWESAHVTFTDLEAGHLAYPAASAAVAAGVMTAGADGTFDPSRVVSGEEALETMARLEALAGIPSPYPPRR